jgi:hypothetical protein
MTGEIKSAPMRPQLRDRTVATEPQHAHGIGERHRLRVLACDAPHYREVAAGQRAIELIVDDVIGRRHGRTYVPAAAARTPRVVLAR